MMAITSFEVGGFLQSVALSGSPDTVFDRAELFSFFANSQVNCPAYGSVAYDLTTATYSVSYNYTAFDAICGNIAPVESLMPNGPLFSDGKFTFQMDMRSYMSALAVDMGILDLKFLDNIVTYGEARSIVDFWHKGIHYLAQQYFDVNYSEMSPIVCVLTVDEGSFVICTVRIDAIFMLPVFNHMGGINTAVYGVPDYCNW